MTINPAKSHFFPSRIKWLENILSSDDFKPDPKKIKAIHNFPRARNLKELRVYF